MARPYPICPTSVYKYFDRSNLLLYVGITSRGVQRQSEHNSDKPWWNYVASQQIEHFSTREEALQREKDLAVKGGIIHDGRAL